MRVCIVFAVDGFAQNNQVRFCVGSFVERFAQRNQVQVCVGLFRGRVFSEYSGAICVESFCGTVRSKYPGASLCSFFVEGFAQSNQVQFCVVFLWNGLLKVTRCEFGYLFFNGMVCSE